MGVDPGVRIRAPRFALRREEPQPHEVPLSRRHHRRGLPLRERERARHPRARQGDRGGGHGSARRHELRRPVAASRSSSSRASAFILSIDDEEFGAGTPEDDRGDASNSCARSSRRSASATPRSRSTCTARRAPRATSRTTSCASCTASSTCSRTRRSSSRATSSARRRPTSTAWRRRSSARWSHYAQDGSYSWHCPGHSGGVAFLKSPVGQMFHQFFGENMLRADVCNAVDELGQLLDHTGPVAASERNAARIFNADHLLLRHQRHVDVEQDGVALPPSRRATSSSSTATATSRSCTRSR